MDIRKLAVDLTAFLAPLLPYLQQAGEKMAGEAATKLGEGVWSRAKALWEKLWPRVAAKERAREAMEDLALRPEDARAQGAVELQLEKILAADAGLAGKLAKLLEEAGPRASWAYLVGEGAIAHGAGAVAAGKGGIGTGRDLVIDATLPGMPRDALEAELRAAKEREHTARVEPLLEKLEAVRLSKEELLDLRGGAVTSVKDVRPPARPESATDIRFTTYTPAAVRPATWATLVAYCHLPYATEAVEKDCKRRLGGSPLRSEGVGLQTIARGAEITVVPGVADCRFNPGGAGVDHRPGGPHQTPTASADAATAGRTRRAGGDPRRLGVPPMIAFKGGRISGCLIRAATW